MEHASTKTASFDPLAQDADAALSDIFGFPSFRPGQREVIDAVIDGEDSIVVMPTGSGKSLCYMLPACVIPGLVIAVSPLIALMKDQTDALEEFGIPATFINSSQPWPEQRRRLDGMRLGAYKLVLVAPERFRNDAFMRAISGLPIGLLAIDEAHCISAWGHDFRPDYLNLGDVRKTLGEPTTLALTATATREVQADMATQLDLPDPKIVVSGFERPNLFFEVYSARRRAEKYARLTAAIDEVDDGSVLVYCATRKQVNRVRDKLRDADHHPAIYHAGLSDQKRDEIQDAFMAGDAPLLVATNAFGMGVDKSDVRLIVHFNIPGSVEAYYQEAGRAGRDGDDAHCLLLYNRNDRRIHEFFIENSFPEPAVVKSVWSQLQRHGTGTHQLDAEMLADHINRGGRGRDKTHPWAIESALRLLQRGGHIEFGTRSSMPWIAVQDMARERELRVDWDDLQTRRQIEERHLDQATRYATGSTCRQDYLVRYFSESLGSDDGCGHCDICCGVPEYGSGSQQREKIICRDDPAILVKKLLSGVARCRGRWGTHAVAGMLRGSKAKKILRGQLDQLSTYGLLDNLRQRDLVRLLDILGRLRLTKQNSHGCISLTDRGQTLMTSDDPLPPDVEKILLRHVAAVDEAPKKRQNKLNRGSKKSKGRAPAKAAAQSADDGELNDTYLRTLRRHRDGEDIDAIASARGLTKSSVLRHLMVLAHFGYDLDLSDYADDKLLPELREIAPDWEPGDPLRELRDTLSTSCNYDDLKLNLAIMLSER